MNKTNKGSGIGLIIAFVIVTTACSGIDVRSFPKPVFHEIKPARSIIRFSVINTAHFVAGENFLYDGGSMWTRRKMVHSAILVEHPNGIFLFDSGLGQKIDTQFEETQWWAGLILAFEKGKSVKQQMKESAYDSSKIKFILPSHLHWDHASGIPDFPNASVHVTKEEYDLATGKLGQPPAFLKSQYEIPKERWKFFNYYPEPFENFKESLDLFKDGSVVLVPLRGHTDGSTGMLLTLKSGRRYFFIGDLVWTLEGILKPARKHFIMGSMTDRDSDKTTRTIVQVHHLSKKYPKLRIIPAHDLDSMQGIAVFPKFEE